MGWAAAVGRRGAAVTDPEPPPGTVVYGPSVVGGAATIRANAGNNAVSDPGGGVRITAASNFDTAINSNPTGTLFVVEANETLNRTSSLSVGTKNPTIVMLSGAKMVGNGGNFPAISSTSGSGLTLKGGTIQNFGDPTKLDDRTSPTPAGRGIRLGGPSLIEDVEIKLCDTGIAGTPSGTGDITIRRCYVHDNYRLGFSVIMDSSPSRLIVEDCEVTANNTSLYDKGFDSGSKFFSSQGGIIIRRCWWHDNHGPGIWCDFFRTALYQAEMYDNVSENNDTWGMFWENSFAVHQHHNLIRNNQTDQTNFSSSTFTQLLWTSSDGSQGPVGVEVNNNDVDQTAGRYVMAIRNDATRPDDPKDYNIHHNRIWLRNTTQPFGFDGQVGGFDTETPKTMWTEPTLSWHDNLYMVGSLSVPYWWWDTGTGDGSPWTWAQWSAKWSNETRTQI